MKRIVFLLCLFNFALLANVRTKLHTNNNTTIANKTKTKRLNNTMPKSKCPVENCLKCTFDLKRCVQCAEKFILQDEKCYNVERLSQFMSDLKSTVSSKEKSVIDFVMKNIVPQNYNAEDDTDELELHPYKKFNSVTKDFNTIRELLADLKDINERECKMKINEFVVDFEQNMQVLMSLASLFEQKTIFEIEKQRNSIMQIINSETIRPADKLDIVDKKIEDLSQMMFGDFETIKSKIKAYQEISDKKIKRTKNSFMMRIKKFLE